MKIDGVKPMTVAKAGLLATGVAGAFLVSTISPEPAQAYPGKATACTGCHQAGGSVTAAPSNATPAPGVAYTVAIALTSSSSGKSGYWISDGAGVNVVGGPVAGSRHSAPMTAPAAAGRYTYTVWAEQGGKSQGQASSATYSIMVGSPPKAGSPTSSTGTATTASSATAAATGPSSAAVGVGGLTLLLAGAGTTWLIRRRGQD